MASRQALESCDLYTVGWITALPLEYTAATAMLDERHGKPLDFIQPHNDTNLYTWGRIGEHNVVISTLAAGVYGTTSAAATALPILLSFPQIRISLLIGIGAGIAKPDQDRDIRLGDIIVGQPERRSGGVVQYDLGKAKPGAQHERKGFLNSPPKVLHKALAMLRAQHEGEPSEVPRFLQEMVRCYPRMAKSYIHQGFENDRLFKPTYKHVQCADCRNCDPNEEVQREERDLAEPEIHYGIIVSSNVLIKDAVTRDKIIKKIEEDCICFEMEAAGLINNFPCLVIRGICDYADSHQNDRWQRYAAATAAAYGKELLGYVSSKDLQMTRKAIDTLDHS
jgi:nucleoside phosphorylase